MPEINELLVRIEKLESSRRRRGWAAVVLLVTLAGFAVWVQTRKPGVVEAREFVVKDASGNVVARLGGTGYGSTCLGLMGTEKVTYASLCVDNHYGSNLQLENGLIRAFLSAGADGKEGPGRLLPAFGIAEEGGNSAAISVGEETTLELGPGIEKNAVKIAAGKAGPTIHMYDAKGKTIWTAPVHP